MKNFICAVLVFCMLALAESASAGLLTKSPEFKTFIWYASANQSEPVGVMVTIRNPKETEGYANFNEIMRRLQLQGLSREDSDNLLFYGLNELYECPYMDYPQTMADIYPRQVYIELTRQFDAGEYPHSFRTVELLKASGLKQHQAQSLYFSALDEHLGCLLEP